MYSVVLNSKSSLLGGQPISIRLPDGTASFHRVDPTRAVWELEYRTPRLEVDLTRSPIDEAVALACERDVAHTRSSLEKIGFHLAARLNDDGRNPSVSRKWNNDEERTWSDRGTTLVVQPMRFRVKDSLNGYEGASDAHLVQEHVRLVIEQREENIRNIYHQILNDVRQGRAESRLRRQA